MTMPHLMNCGHSPDSWCLDCVREMHDELTDRAEDAEGRAVRMATEIERLTKALHDVEHERDRYRAVAQQMLGWAAEEIARLSAENTALHATVARLTRVGALCANERQGSCRGFKAVTP